MLDVGGTIRLRHTVLDADGVLAVPAAAELRITLPDGSTVEPDVSAAAEMVYDYVPAVYGRHVVSWRTTGPATAYTDVFNVAAPDWPAIVGLEETKRHLNIPADDTVDDDELRGFILSASMVVEDIVGVVARRTITETASGGSRHIVLVRSPVIDVVEVRVDGELLDSGDYQVSPSGLLSRRSGNWPAGLRNIDVTYLVGRSAVQPNIIDATKELIRINWRPRQGGNYSAFDGGSGDDFGGGGVEASLQGNLRLGFFVPNTVIQRLQPDQRPPVVL